MTTTSDLAAVHPIGVVAERTGLSVDVIRVWERRYRVVEPERAPNGQRLYSDADVERLRLLHRATGAGRGIGQIARLSTAEVAALVEGDDVARRDARAPAAAPAHAGAARVVAEALDRARALDKPGLEAVLTRAASQHGVPVFLEEVVSPLFRRIGDEWHAGRLTPSQEHLATSVVRPMLSRLGDALAAGPRAPHLVVATPPGERHEVGALLATVGAALDGWRVTYLGPDLPVSEIASAARLTGARAVGVSVVYPPDPDALLEELRRLRDLLPPDISLLVGGAAVSQLDERLTRAGAFVIYDLDEMRAVLRDLVPAERP
jgi:MerR family transcriptional regulator, light-induced transcriptional regulator